MAKRSRCRLRYNPCSLCPGDSAAAVVPLVSRKFRIMPESAMTHIQRVQDITVVAFGPQCKHIDEPVVEAVSREVMDVVSSASPPKVALDLTQTEFFGSSFIEVLFRAWNRLQNKPGGQMALIGLAPYCREVLEITHLDKLWPIYDSQDAAVKAMTGG